MQEGIRRRTREAPKAPERSEGMKLPELGHIGVMNPEAAWARVESSNRERAGRRGKTVCRRGVLSGVVLGGGKSPLQGEGPDGSTWPAKETHAGHGRAGAT